MDKRQIETKPRFNGSSSLVLALVELLFMTAAILLNLLIPSLLFALAGAVFVLVRKVFRQQEAWVTLAVAYTSALFGLTHTSLIARTQKRTRYT